MQCLASSLFRKLDHRVAQVSCVKGKLGKTLTKIGANRFCPEMDEIYHFRKSLEIAFIEHEVGTLNTT